MRSEIRALVSLYPYSALHGIIQCKCWLLFYQYLSHILIEIQEKITVLPPDLLIYQAWDKVSDVHFANDLFTHLGWFSSFEFRNQLNFGKKYNRMRGAGEKCYASRQRYSYVKL